MVNGFCQSTIVVDGFFNGFFTCEPLVSMVFQWFFYMWIIGVNGFSMVFQISTIGINGFSNGFLQSNHYHCMNGLWLTIDIDGFGESERWFTKKAKTQKKIIFSTKTQG